MRSRRSVSVVRRLWRREDVGVAGDREGLRKRGFAVGDRVGEKDRDRVALAMVKVDRDGVRFMAHSKGLNSTIVDQCCRNVAPTLRAGAECILQKIDPVLGTADGRRLRAPRQSRRWAASVLRKEKLPYSRSAFPANGRVALRGWLQSSFARTAGLAFRGCQRQGSNPPPEVTSRIGDCDAADPFGGFPAARR